MEIYLAITWEWEKPNDLLSITISSDDWERHMLDIKCQKES